MSGAGSQLSTGLQLRKGEASENATPIALAMDVRNSNPSA
jgi:hypothetical protein